MVPRWAWKVDLSKLKREGVYIVAYDGFGVQKGKLTVDLRTFNW